LTRPPLAASTIIVALTSSIETCPNALAFDPRQDFRFAKAPILAEAEAWQSVERTLAYTFINPRDVHLEQLGDFWNGQKLVLTSSFPACGRASWRGMASPNTVRQGAIIPGQTGL